MIDLDDVLSSSYDDDSEDQFLSEIPISLMKENIKDQFECPLENRNRDHIETFIKMYQFSKDNVNAYEDSDLDEIIEMRDDFYIFMRQLFNTYLGIGFVDFDDKSQERQDDLIHYTYRFFIKNIKKNFVSYIMTVIGEKHDEYGRLYDEYGLKKDVTSASFKKEIDDGAGIYVLSKLSDVIDDILSEEISIDEFFEKCDGDDPRLETKFVKEAFDDLEITGNFVENYIQMIDADFISEIESKVRNKVLKQSRNKAATIASELTDESDVEESTFEEIETDEKK